MLPLPYMDSDETRRSFDDTACVALGIDSEVVSTIRRSLAAEPAVTGKTLCEILVVRQLSCDGYSDSDLSPLPLGEG